MNKEEEKNINRLPPQDTEAEQSVLGSTMIDKEAYFKVADILQPSDFYLGSHKKIFEAITELSQSSEPLDVLTVSSKLKAKNELENIGGQAMLTSLVNSVPSAAHVAHYANIVRKKSVLRKLIEASHEIAQLGYKEEEDVHVLLDEAEKNIFQISQTANTDQFNPMKSSLEEAFERIDNLHKNTGELRGIPTGFTDLDNILAGFQKSDLVILAARPSLGKSSLALDIARNASMKTQTPVGIFSLEMSQDQIIDRFIAAQANVDLWKLRTGKLSHKEGNNDFAKIQDALGSLSEAPVYIDDGLTSTVLQMRAMARRLQAEKGLGLLIIDYLQLITPRIASDSAVQQVTEISRSLKALARELNIPVLALSQLSRAIEHRGDGTPKLSDLRESGSIEQDADVVMFISRELNPAEEEDVQGSIAEIHVAKHRNGPIGKVQTYFNKKTASFSNLAKENIAYGGGELPQEPPPEAGPEDIPS